MALPTPTTPFPLGKHVSFRGLLHNKPVVRSYTPTLFEDHAPGMRFLIKMYPEGQMSTILRDLKVGETLEAMGPIGHANFPNLRDFREIVFVAGGTGITPIYPMIVNLLSEKERVGSMTLLYANNCLDDILLLDKLRDLGSVHKQFRVHHILKEAPLSSNNLSIETGFCTKEIIKKYTSPQSLIMICGPPKMEDFVVEQLKVLGPGFDKYFTFTKAALTVEHKTVLDSVNLHKYFKMSEVEKHNKESDCWTVIEDKVYDMTKFIDEHPGGYIILDGAGKDATELFNVEFVHSADARKELDRLQIGLLEK
eukprot:TRINITY_DN2057_c0_g1_i2.p1 TRINITY_DN2057_c0_g1~~TRINITY_DN2057_c0_g1_i2.p1  ORF type:complete len:309 (-),score=70.16 TRINITY_DN2057_c0_g1_i2:68-994(-)